MRIRKIKIHHWRHFENVELELSNEAPLVCLVGANGTGKSHLLELIASCAHRLGLSQGIEIPRVRLQRRSYIGAVLAVVGKVLPLKLVSCGISGDVAQPV